MSGLHIARRAPAALRWSWLWLALGGALFAFATVQQVIAAAAWLAPIFLLRAARMRRLRSGLPLIFLALCGAALSALNGYLDPPPPAWLSFAIALSYAAILSLPYLIDGLLAPRLAGWPRLLVFPTALTALDWLLIFHPFPTFGSPAYSQYGNLPLMQLASLTGIWGITFLIGWSAATVNALWEAGWERRAMARYGVPFALALALVLLYGGARLHFSPPADQTVQVAALPPNRELWRYPPLQALARGSAAERAAQSAAAELVLDDLLERSAAAAQAGAQIVVWAETALFVPEEDLPAMLSRAAALARAEGIYLQVGLGVIKRSERHPYAENRAVLFDPRGEQLWDYHKARLVPVGDAAEMAPGPQRLPSVDTLFGRLATAICYDAAAPDYVRQAGQAGVSLLMVPADDWYQNRHDHARMHVFRAIENGAALVRPTAKGITLITDQLGRILASSDYFNAPPLGVTMVAVPVQSVPTLYALIGDSFAYGCIALLCLLGLPALTRRPLATALARPGVTG